MVVVDSAKFGSVFARVWTQWRCKTRPNNASHDARLVLTLYARPFPSSSLHVPQDLAVSPEMMKTRRKSKAAAAAAAAASYGHSTRENSPAPAPATHDATITVAIPDDVDITVLSNLLPDYDLQSPSADAIVALFRLVAAQASDSDATQRELEEARAEIERKSVELEQALQDRESSTTELEATLDSVRKELEQVKREKDELGAYRIRRTYCLGGSNVTLQLPPVLLCKHRSLLYRLRLRHLLQRLTR